MNKLKVAIQALQDYLGRDEGGRRLLGEITVIANEYRKRNATLEAAAIESAALVKKLRSDLDKATSEVVSTKQESSVASARLTAAAAREKVLSEEIAKLRAELEPAEDEVKPDLAQLQPYLQLFKAVKRRFKQMPGSAGDGYDITLEDVVKSYSQDQFAGLGMVMAVCALMNMPLRLKAERTMQDMKDWQKWKEQYTGRFIQWMSHRFHTTPTEDRLSAPFSNIPFMTKL